jgi:hypothetical protein
VSFVEVLEAVFSEVDAGVDDHPLNPRIAVGRLLGGCGDVGLRLGPQLELWASNYTTGAL